MTVDKQRKLAARQVARGAGISYTAARRRLDAAAPPPPPVQWVEAPELEAPDGHVWQRPAPADCLACDCHTERVCSSYLWARATRPGGPRRSCPCEEAAEAAEYGTVTVALGSELYAVTIEWRHGALRTARMWAGLSSEGEEAPAPLVMTLIPVGAGLSGPVVTDRAGRRWVQLYGASHGAVMYRITGLWAGPNL